MCQLLNRSIHFNQVQLACRLFIRSISLFIHCSSMIIHLFIYDLVRGLPPWWYLIRRALNEPLHFSNVRNTVVSYEENHLFMVVY